MISSAVCRFMVRLLTPRGVRDSHTTWTTFWVADQFQRLPSYSPQLNPIERLWKALRRRATHNRLFDTLADLKQSLRANLYYFQTMRGRVKTLLQSKRKKVNRTVSLSV